ncbi:hypothetical protein [Pseudomonas phage PIP]|nr:hypothetical protein [Pseudomonas phage PIP]
MGSSSEVVLRYRAIVPIISLGGHLLFMEVLHAHMVHPLQLDSLLVAVMEILVRRCEYCATLRYGCGLSPDYLARYAAQCGGNATMQITSRSQSIPPERIYSLVQHRKQCRSQHPVSHARYPRRGRASSRIVEKWLRVDSSDSVCIAGRTYQSVLTTGRYRTMPWRSSQDWSLARCSRLLVLPRLRWANTRPWFSNDLEIYINGLDSILSTYGRILNRSGVALPGWIVAVVMQDKPAYQQFIKQCYRLYPARLQDPVYHVGYRYVPTGSGRCVYPYR